MDEYTSWFINGWGDSWDDGDGSGNDTGDGWGDGWDNSDGYSTAIEDFRQI